VNSSVQSIAQASAGLSFSQTIARELAHRRALAEVFVADSSEVGDGSYLVAMQVPRAHSLWSDRRVPYHDTLATLEASRQAAFVIVHRHLAVPIGPPFTLHRVAFQVVDIEGYRDDETAPLEAIWHAHVVNRQVHEGILTGMTLQGRLLADGSPIATLDGDIAFMPREEYETIRAVQRAQAERDGAFISEPAPRVEPQLLGRFDKRNVVIGDAASPSGDDGKSHYPLVVDQRHPAFYDHPQDHVPGPLMVEAYRQAALLTAQREGALPSPAAAVTGCHGKFDGFCEQDAPARCSAVVTGVSDGRVTVALELHQFGKRIADATMELTPYP
jgi:hypothetical protein